jgi:hypothetical protein
MKLCCVCNKTLPFSNFHKRTLKTGNISYQAKCKECSTTIRRQYYKPHEFMRRKFKLTEDQYNNLMKNENCQICNVELTKKCIDHCHSSNKVRGVLCNNCNTALGLVGDNVSILSEMIKYLQKHQ